MSDNPNILFHMARRRDYRSIMAHGLLPYNEMKRRFNDPHKGLSNYNSFDNVFLTDCIVHIVRWQSGLSWMEMNKAFIIAVDADKAENVEQYYFGGCIQKHEFVTPYVPPSAFLWINAPVYGKGKILHLDRWLREMNHEATTALEFDSYNPPVVNDKELIELLGKL